MSAFSLVFTLIIYWRSCISSPCIPANTCFPRQVGNDDYRFDSSWKYRCETTKNVYKDVWLASTTCEGDPDGGSSELITLNGAIGDAAGVIDDKGDRVFGAASGSYKTDYLQGINCPVLNEDSDTCTDFFMIKHRGDVDFEETWQGTPDVQRPYLDIGDNCTNYINDPSAFALYDQIFLPYGCVNQNTGSKKFECDANSWKYTKYKGMDCTDEVLPDQSEGPFVFGRCGYFYEFWNIEVEEEWWYWYDLVCCPAVTGKKCYGDAEPTTSPGKGPLPALSPAPGPAGPLPTSNPAPGPAGNLPTTSPITGLAGPLGTPSPVPGSGGSTPNTLSGQPPTSPGTAKPTAPTTHAPTDSSGNVQPTPPTTAAPTSPGTAKPTPAPTDDVTRISMVLCALFGVMVTLRVV